MEHTTVPDVIFKTRVRDESIVGDNPFMWKDVSSAEIFEGKRVVLFGLPGAFTPVCSSVHLPGYEAHYDAFKDIGIDAVVCTSVNDAFVMYQWARSLGISKVFMLPDGNGEFAQKLGMLVKKENLGFGNRSWRYSMYVENGEIQQTFVEPGMRDNAMDDPFEISDANTMLAYLEGNRDT